MLAHNKHIHSLSHTQPGVACLVVLRGGKSRDDARPRLTFTPQATLNTRPTSRISTAVYSSSSSYSAVQACLFLSPRTCRRRPQLVRQEPQGETVMRHRQGPGDGRASAAMMRARRTLCPPHPALPSSTTTRWPIN
jgi:hypothetical protein